MDNASAVNNTDNKNTKQYLSFQIAGERYGVDILHVKEILQFDNITPVPMMPESIAGVINLRGNIVSVVDLAARFNHQLSRKTARTCIVIVELALEHESFDIGIMVDLVNEVLEIQQENLEPGPNFGSRIRADFIESIGRIDDEFIILLKMEQVLSIDELSIVEELRINLPLEQNAS